jgi:hypothetical protein
MGSIAQAQRVQDLAQTENLAQTMVERIIGTTSHAEALRELRAAFPESPLTLRVAALAMLARKSAAGAKPPHMPR